MRIKWIGQSGYIIKTDSTEIIIDPYLSDVVNKVANRPRMVKPPINPTEITAHAVICTHNHLDHLDTDAISQMDEHTHFITTNEGKTKLDTLNRFNVSVLNQNESITVRDIKITAVFALHTVEAFGVILEAEGKALYFSGDTLYDERLFETSRFKPHITFICINGKLGNMNVDEAVKVAKEIGAEINIPNHYGMFISNTEDPTRFTEKLDNGFIMEFNKEYSIDEILN